MKYLLRAALLALPLLAVPTRANAHGETLCSIADAFASKLRCLAYPACGCCGCGGGCGGAYPWYSYWPYEAHFQTPAHPEFPFWPRPMTAYPPQQYNAPSPAPSYMPILPTGYGYQTGYYQPTGYGYQTGYYQPPVYPSYWYGH
jgi:hypothetical protein